MADTCGDPSRYDVIWDSPSGDESGSTPLGNGDIGLNAWIDRRGSLLFYISKTDSWDESGRLLKVGKIRIDLDAGRPLPLTPFRQTLDLATGTIAISCGEGETAVHLRLWVDANHSAICVEIESSRPLAATASIELWRLQPLTLPSIEVSDVMLNRDEEGDQHAPTVVEPDVLLPGRPGCIGWYHHNARSAGPSVTAANQGLDGFDRPDPLLHRTFGAVVTSSGATPDGDRSLISPKSTEHRFDLLVLTQHPATPEQWLATVDESRRSLASIPFEQRRRDHLSWWKGFWGRSWIHVTASAAKTGKPKPDGDAYLVSRGYALQRFLNACAGRGRYPIKFNGSIFTVAHEGEPGGADYRRWGPGYWWQNTRLPYISMCASGDFDLMQPFFRMYGEELMPLCRYRTRRYFGHDGAFIPECIYFWGDVFSDTYGWTPYSERLDKLQDSGYHKWEWVSGPELVFMMIDYYEHTLDASFLAETLLPAAHDILTFFDQHYDTGDDGRLVMHPSQALETWWDCTDPMPEVAGLHAVTARLLSLPHELTSPPQRVFWTALAQKLPHPPTRTVDGRRMLAPAARFTDKRNIENAELYAVFPFRLFAVGRDDIELAEAALECREDRGHIGWRQDDIFMAYLGLADQAREYLVARAGEKHADSRFPAFWGPNYDWIPDQDHGSVLLKTLQAMLLQTDGRVLYLLPAWPRDWDVEFKLHAPFDTVVEVAVSEGEIVRLVVTPAERLDDVVTTWKKSGGREDQAP